MAISVVDKKELILYFDTDQDLGHFMAWYKKNSNTHIQYFAKEGDKDWLYIKRRDGVCPKCEHFDLDSMVKSLQHNKDKRKVELVCEKCEHKYKVSNCYFEKVKV